MLTQGLGLGIGAQAFGWWMGKCTTGDVVDWSQLWYATGFVCLGSDGGIRSIVLGSLQQSLG